MIIVCSVSYVLHVIVLDRVYTSHAAIPRPLCTGTVLSLDT